MKLLALDTCTEVCSVSLYIDGVHHNRFISNVAKSANLILPLCEQVLDEAKISIAALDGIIYSKGPGAFTGVRVCIAVVQGLSLAHNIPTLGFSTLELLAYGASQKYQTSSIAAALDARMGQVYWGVYQNQQLMTQVLENPDKVAHLGKDFIGVGSGWGAYPQVLSKQSGVLTYNADFYPKASNLIRLALLHLKSAKSLASNLPLPTYLRNNVANTLK